MRILSWNINGIRTLPQYHPWNTFKTCEGILDELNADIICFQEMKSSRPALPRDVALPEHYHSFFSFPANKGGYSGVAIYVDSRKITPLKAEEGLSGRLQPKPLLTAEERISPSYPYPHEMDLFAEEDGEVPSTFDTLDSEGRGLMIDFGLFVLINVYCPNETSDARLSFKMNYHLLLQERVRKLVEEEHREVIVLGDINVCAAPVDHCDGHLPSNMNSFFEHPARAWFHKWLSPNGPMVDVLREFHPDRKGMFTCWNLKIQARESNYGTRIDYFLVTRGLLPWISGGDIQASLKGSDHCPLYIDLRDDITLESGEVLTLRDAMRQRPDLTEPPRLASKFWDEFSGKQTVLSAFFGKRSASKDGSDLTSSQPTPPPTQASIPALSQTESTLASVSPSISKPAQAPEPSVEPPKKFRPSQASRSTNPKSSSSTKRKPTEPTAPAPSGKKRKQAGKGQASISSFFSKPAAGPSSSSPQTSQPQEIIDLDEDDGSSVPPTMPTPGSIPSSSQLQSADADTADQLDADYRLACALAAESPPSPDASPSGSQADDSSRGKEKDREAWSALFARVPPPRCTVHGEPARRYTVNKPGPNRGKTFYLCARPVGPGYDKGRGERARDEVDHRYRCNFFKWAGEARREAMREKRGS